MISVEELLAPLPGASPCGEDLSYDPALSDLETRLQGKPETQFAPAEEPNWRDVQKLCLELFGRTKDLRVTIALTLALLELEDLPGFAQGMTLLRGILEQYWPTLYPKLDPDDNNDPLERMNLLASIAAPEGTFGDTLRVIGRLRQAPLCKSSVAGSISLAQITEATMTPAPTAEGEAPAPSGPNPAAIQAAFRDTPAEFLETQLAAATTALGAVEGIDVFLNATIGAGNAANLEPLTAVLREMKTRVAAYAPSAAGAALGDAASAVDASPASAPPTAARGPSAPGSINSRDDVIRALDAICAFYAGSEPSSPVPAMLQQAKNLVGRGFLEILQVLTPDATPQVKLTPPGA